MVITERAEMVNALEACMSGTTQGPYFTKRKKSAFEKKGAFDNYNFFFCRNFKHLV